MCTNNDGLPYRYEEDQRYPIELPWDSLPYESKGEPKFRVGDMVGWNKHTRDKSERGEDSDWLSSWKADKKYAIIKEAFWVLVDWVDTADEAYFNPRDKRADDWSVPYYTPEYSLYWNDGENTYTSQSCLELIAGASDGAE